MVYKNHNTMKKPKLKKGIYQHFKNKKFYEVLEIVRHTETEEWMVFYKPLYRSPFADRMVRPYKMFFEKTKPRSVLGSATGAKHPETGKLVLRFEFIKK